MRFGVLNFSIAPYQRLAARWQQFEQLGFDNAWIADDVLIRGYADFESWTLLGALARETERMTIGTLVTTIRFRHPAFLASQVLGLDQISGGRATVAIGAGEPFQNETVGDARWSAKETAERLEEQAATLSSLLRGEATDFTGTHYSTKTGGFFEGETMEMPQPATLPRPPLVVAAHGPKGIRTAARHADAWNCFGGQSYGGGPNPDEGFGSRTFPEALEHMSGLLDRVNEACDEVGRDPATLERTVLAFYPTPDPFSSLDAFDEYVGSYEELGISSMTFYWPPIDHQLEDRDTSAVEQERFESICAQRVGSR